jgi:hypothetical protein
VYEGGVARINASGSLVWHVDVTWNDVPGELNGEQFAFSREEQDGTLRDWHLNLATGERVE